MNSLKQLTKSSRKKGNIFNQLPNYVPKSTTVSIKIIKNRSRAGTIQRLLTSERNKRRKVLLDEIELSGLARSPTKKGMIAFRKIMEQNPGNVVSNDSLFYEAVVGTNLSIQ